LNVEAGPTAPAHPRFPQLLDVSGELFLVGPQLHVFADNVLHLHLFNVTGSLGRFPVLYLLDLGSLLFGHDFGRNGCGLRLREGRSFCLANSHIFPYPVFPAHFRAVGVGVRLRLIGDKVNTGMGCFLIHHL
jgi:hypothetical protein